MLHNIGGSYMANGKSNLCSPKGKETLDTYSRLLRDYGPPGVVNYSFQQISALYRGGRAAMSFESSNELRTVMDGGERLKDTGLAPFPAGEAGQVPTAIGWGLAVSAYSKQPDAAWYFVQWATSPEIQKRMALQGIAPPRPAVANDPEYRKWIDAEPVRKEWQAALDVLATKGSSEVGYPDRRQSAIARIHRPGGAGPDPEAEDRRSGLCRCGQGARCADRAKVAAIGAGRTKRPAPGRRLQSERKRKHVGCRCDIDAGPAKAGTVGALGAGSDLHCRDDRVPGRLHDLAQLPELFVDRPAVLCGPRRTTRSSTSDYEFWNGLWVTIALYVLSLVLQLVFGVWLALVLFHAKRLPGIVRSMFISPFMMPPVVAGMMWLVILDPSLGAANYILQTLGLPPSEWLASPTWVIPTSRADRQLAMDALCRADRARRAAVAAAERL